MDTLTTIKNKIIRQQYELSKHAVDQSILRNIEIKEIEQAIQNQSEIIEDYPDDKYGASCLIFGRTLKRRPLHILCSYPDRDLVKIITLYEPDPNLWEDFKNRKS
jgi:hypothetical protein